jgi:hypothetical protein
MLAINFFNLGEVKKSNYFHSKAMRQETEPLGSRIVELAKCEIRLKFAQIERDRMIDVHAE